MRVQDRARIQRLEERLPERDDVEGERTRGG